MDEREIRAQELGRRLAEAVSTMQRANHVGMSRETWTVSSVNSDGTCDLTRGDGAQSLPGIPYTTACVGIQAGARAVVDTCGHVPLVTGVLAGSVGTDIVHPVGSVIFLPDGTEPSDVGIEGSWTLVRFMLYNLNSGKVLEIYGAATEDGATANQFTANYSTTQQWYVRAIDVGSTSASGVHATVGWIRTA